jgi:HSP20 family protein
MEVMIMAKKEQELQVQEAEKQEIIEGDAERTRARKAFVPRVDIFEDNDAITILADIPGVDAESLDITLEKEVLTINGFVEPVQPEDYSLAYAEYEEGDFVRRFTLSNKIDQEKIEASVKDGVLHLRLPKIGPAKARKIAVAAA